jgi:hypothetical protein
MCAIHSRVIDYGPSVALFTIDVLRGWKITHEASVTVSGPTTDAIADALIGRTTGVSTQDAAIMASIRQHNQQAAFSAATSTVAPSAGPMTSTDQDTERPRSR